MIQGTFGGHVGDMAATITTNPGNITAISLNPATLGQVLWTQTYQPAAGNLTRLISGFDPSTGIFTFTDKENFANWGFSLATGKNVWGPSYPAASPSEDWDYAIWNTGFCDYGNFYSDGYSGCSLAGTTQLAFCNGHMAMVDRATVQIQGSTRPMDITPNLLRQLLTE
jgi:hypothetical protein